jgi:GNAT superfamily N-acetyltransferase
LNIRVAGDDDVAVLWALRRSWAEEDAGGPIDDDGFERAFEAWLASERDTRTFFLVEVDGVAIGMGNVKTYSRMPAPGRPSDAWGYVGNVYVHADRRGDRIGAALMDAMIAWAWEHGFDKLRLSPATRAVPFYERLGFAPSALLQLDR